jgi:Tol biopolymer transport system component
LVTPNPFATQATIVFMTNSSGRTNIKVYSIEGKQLGTLYDSNAQAGETYQVTLDATNLPSGMYFVEMTNVNGKKMLVKAMISY